MDDTALIAVKELAELRKLSLYGSSVTDNGVKSLIGLEHLEALGLGKTKITQEGLSSLKESPSLTWLWVTKSPDLTDSAISALKKARPELTVYDK